MNYYTMLNGPVKYYLSFTKPMVAIHKDLLPACHDSYAKHWIIKDCKVSAGWENHAVIWIMPSPLKSLQRHLTV